MSEDDTDQPKNKDGLFSTLKAWYAEDWEKTCKWRDDARTDFAYVAGDQWDEKDKQKLREQLRPVITMNRVDPIIDSVSGAEVANRQEVRYLPREAGDVEVNEVLTSAAQWFRDNCDAEDEESDAFRDTIICGMGWTETRLDYETEPDGEPVIERVDPVEMVWDCQAKKRNLVDARRVWHAKEMSLADAKVLVPGKFEDADYNATWASGQESKEGHDSNGRAYRPGNGASEQEDEASKKVTLVRVQWWERKRVNRVLTADAQGRQQIIPMSDEELKEYKARAEVVGVVPRVVPGYQRVFRQAYLGRKILEIGDAPCKDHFSFACITGKRDRNQNSWYGLVRGMRDPQNWANKFFSQILHIINTTAKGGVIAERGAFDDDKKAEETWARQDAITWARSGMLAKGAIQPKPNNGFPAQLANLLEFAISSIRDVSGVNVETLGMAQASGQAASLDMQRKQAAMMILQPLFDSLRRYRKVQGRMMLYLIQNYLSDGRLIRIVGEEQARYVPLAKDPTKANVKYDIIVDDAPTSPNQKEQTWTLLQQLLPAIGKMIPPKTYLALLKYSPLPTSAQQEIRKSLEPPIDPQTGQPVPPPPDPDVVRAKAQMEIEAQKAQQQMQIEREKAMLDAEIQRSKANTEIEVEKLKTAAKLELERESGQQRLAIQREQANAELIQDAFSGQQEAALRAQQFERDSALQDRQALSDIARRDQASEAEIARRKSVARAKAPA